MWILLCHIQDMEYDTIVSKGKQLLSFAPDNVMLMSTIILLLNIL